MNVKSEITDRKVFGFEFNKQWDYEIGTVPGATRAIDEFLLGKNLTIEKLPISHIPAYIRKE